MSKPEDEMREILTDLFIAFILNLIFLALISLVLWPLGRIWLGLSLAKGYALFWLVIIASIMVVSLIERVFRLNIYDSFDAYVLVNLIASAVPMAGWSAFAALTLRSFAAGAPVWLAAILYVIGFLSCYAAFVVVTTFYQGTIYRLANLLLALVSYLTFTFWPAAAWAIYGWFFAFFGMTI